MSKAHVVKRERLRFTLVYFWNCRSFNSKNES